MNQSISQQLRQTRLERNLSLAEISKATRIRQPFLEAMEAGDFSALPSAVQARGFLRTYAEYLGLDAAPLLENMGWRDTTTQPKPPTQAVMHPPYPGEGQSLEGTSSAGQPRPISNVSIFEAIGAQLRGQRETLGLSLEEVEEQTLIRTHYLTALETGDFASLPSTVQGRGMLKNYASYLGLDQEALLLQFAEGVQIGFQAKILPERARPKPAAPASKSPPAPRQPTFLRRLFSGDLFWGVSLIVLLVGFVGWGLLTILSTRRTQTVQPTPPSIADVLLKTPTLTITPTLATPTATNAGIFYPTVIITQQPLDEGGTPEGTPIVNTSPGKVHLNVIVRQRAWMRVVVDGEVQFEGRVQPGSAYPYSAAQRIELVTGNAAGLQVYYNDQDLGVLGYQNQVVERIYTDAGIETPMPTITPTPTITLTPSMTPRFSPTPTVEGVQ